MSDFLEKVFRRGGDFKEEKTEVPAHRKPKIPPAITPFGGVHADEHRKRQEQEWYRKGDALAWKTSNEYKANKIKGEDYEAQARQPARSVSSPKDNYRPPPEQKGVDTHRSQGSQRVNNPSPQSNSKPSNNRSSEGSKGGLNTKTSIVDWMKSQGYKDTSVEARKKLFVEHGIDNSKKDKNFSANVALMKALDKRKLNNDKPKQGKELNTTSNDGE